jgi:hypothetical protein
MNIIAATATATPTRRSMSITVETDGVITELTDSWIPPDLGRALEFAGELDSITKHLIGTRVEWMITEETADLIVLTLDDGAGEDEDENDDELEEYLFEVESDWMFTDE